MERGRGGEMERGGRARKRDGEMERGRGGEMERGGRVRRRDGDSETRYSVEPRGESN